MPTLPFSCRNNLGHGGTKGSKTTGLIMKESDLVISLGSRLAVPFVGTKLDAFSEKAKVVMVDVDESELKKPGVKIHLPIKANVKNFITRLSDKLTAEDLPNYDDWMKRGYYPNIRPRYQLKI